MAKAVSLALEEQRSGRPARAAYPTAQPLIPVIAIPTTYAGSEMTPIYGVTHTGDSPPRKITVRDAKITPKLVIYDTDLTLNLPAQITASSGINALAHCIEALYSISRSPLATAAALQGIRFIIQALPRCTTDGFDKEARSDMLAGSHLAAYSLAVTTMGLHHGLCHVLGGSANVPHGIANCIILPHAMRFNLDATAPQLALAAEPMGLRTDRQSEFASAEAVVDHVNRFIGQLGLPQRLRDAGVKEQQLPELAQLALQSRAVRDNPKPVTEAVQIEAILQAAW
jgi:alcohol dehydrogenase class IV